MSSTDRSAAKRMSRNYSRASCVSGGGCKGHWSGTNIAAMVVSFVLFWPVGLVVLFWILKGRNVKDLPAAIADKWRDLSGQWGSDRVSSGNSVFNEFQQTQYDRIREIKDEIKERSSRFNDFRADAKRRADEEEFRQFMASSPSSDS